MIWLFSFLIALSRVQEFQHHHFDSIRFITGGNQETQEKLGSKLLCVYIFVTHVHRLEGFHVLYYKVYDYLDLLVYISLCSMLGRNRSRHFTSCSLSWGQPTVTLTIERSSQVYIEEIPAFPTLVCCTIVAFLQELMLLQLFTHGCLCRCIHKRFDTV